MDLHSKHYCVEEIRPRLCRSIMHEHGASLVSRTEETVHKCVL